jgi:hypothetical protein
LHGGGMYADGVGITEQQLIGQHHPQHTNHQ